MTESDLPHLLDFSRDELRAALQAAGQPAYRADQVLRGVFQGRADDFAAMTSLPQGLREALNRQYIIRAAVAAATRTARDGTVKALLRWRDEVTTETVLLPAGSRNTVCVSTQVGCAVGCAFCASGEQGLARSLGAGEIVEQVLWARDQLGAEQRLSNVVLMGMGEPLLNYDNVMKAVRTINADWGLAIGARHITLSTVGLPEGIRRLAEEPLQLTLAVSLHASDDLTRQELIPWARKVSLPELFEALRDYYARTHREVTFEYLLLKDVNDSIGDAEALAAWTRRVRSNVNIISYHATPGGRFEPSPANRAARFAARLRDLGVNVNVRSSRGADIEAACGQLRRRQSPRSDKNAPEPKKMPTPR